MKGLEAEQQQYDIAAREARQEAHYTAVSTAIQEAHSNRELYLSMGRTRGEVAGGGSLDILRSSAQQGALQTAALGQQGLIQEQAYEEQAASYEAMANATGQPAKAENLASIGSFIGAGISGATAGATGYLALAALAV
jgi:hypothetical protein